MARRGYGTIVADGTFVISDKYAVLEKLFAIGTNTTVLAIYDTATTAGAVLAARRYQKTMASADVDLGLPMSTGITVIASSAAGTTIISWSR